MKRKSSIKVVSRNSVLLERIKYLKGDHPFWGYRRIWAYLKYTEGYTVNLKRIYRLMKEHNLLVKDNPKLKAKRTANTSKPRPTRPYQWWGVDMTKIMTGTGYAYIVIVLDWYTKKVVGHYVGYQAKACHWLIALNKAVNQHFPTGVRNHNLNLMSDNGSQPTSVSFMKACSLMDIKQAFTSYNNPKGNADTERMMRTLKEELFWLREWSSISQVEVAMDKYIHYYNNHYRHSSLKYRTPAEMENLTQPSCLTSPTFAA